MRKGPNSEWIIYLIIILMQQHILIRNDFKYPEF